MERHTICFPSPGTNVAMHHGDARFKAQIERLYATSENNALEGLVSLKSRLRGLTNYDFWDAITEGISKLLGAEFAFVMKRMLVDDSRSAVEMPPLGEPGSCLMAAAMHYCANDGTRHASRENKYHAYGCPCAYMRHDKVFLIPEKLNDFITDNPNPMPTPAEAYIAVPLLSQGKVVAHCGVMWTEASAAQRTLSWAFIEMLMHSLEDMIAMRLEEGSNFVRPAPVPRERSSVIPHDAVTVAQSLRPYAGSLSHELRTPMQGVVGMLDVMHATVLEAAEVQADPHLRRIFEDLIANIQVVQDSSRRAVEAADNVVHAYDMNMSVPETSSFLPDDSADSLSPFSVGSERRPEILVTGSNLPMARSNKRRMDEAFPSRHNSNVSAKFQRLEGASSVWSRHSDTSQEAPEVTQGAQKMRTNEVFGVSTLESPRSELEPVLQHSAKAIAPGLRQTSMCEVIRYVIHDGLKVGGRPDSTLAKETEHGELIEVRSRGSDGTLSSKVIEWSVDPNVPSTVLIDEKDLTKLVSCVFLNAIKFSDQITGRIGIHARLSSRSKYVSIRIKDNGPGIPRAFLPKLFKAFSQENGSITRQSEGLGLGLMVAKGIARKLGGDLMCIRTETDGTDHGSEFEIKLPVMAGEIISRPASPFGSPIPRRADLTSVNTPQTPITHPASPSQLSSALQEVVGDPCSSCGNVVLSPDTSPMSTAHPSLHALQAQRSRTPAESKPPRNGKRHSDIDRDLAFKYPLNFLVADDNKILRKLLVTMLRKLGYKNVHEAHDGAEAVRQMTIPRPHGAQIDVVLMDLWMPVMSGSEAAKQILKMGGGRPTVLAVTADVTDGALESAAEAGMVGFLTKPFKLLDLERLITEYCAYDKVEMR